MEEHSLFVPQAEAADLVPDSELADIGAEWTATRRSVQPQLDPTWMPRRHRRPPRQSLSSNEWLRWTVNYRRGLDNGWVYGLITWNIAMLTEKWEPTLFLGSPDRQVSELASLR